jgi:hypothetical protein
MKTRFAFGKEGIDVELPDRYEYELIESRSASPLADMERALDEASGASIIPMGRAPNIGKMSASIRRLTVSE